MTEDKSTSKAKASIKNNHEKANIVVKDEKEIKVTAPKTESTIDKEVKTAATAKSEVKPAATAKSEVKTAATAKNEVKDKIENTVKNAAKKAESKAAVLKTTADKAVAKKKAEVKKTVRKTEKKSADIIKNVKKDIVNAVTADKCSEKVILQYRDMSIDDKQLKEDAMNVWKYDMMRDLKDISSMELYVKPEENRVYFVINGTETGSFGI